MGGGVALGAGDAAPPPQPLLPSSSLRGSSRLPAVLSSTVHAAAAAAAAVARELTPAALLHLPSLPSTSPWWISPAGGDASQLVDLARVIYWELLTKGPAAAAAANGETLDRCYLEMEEALNSVYRHSRVADGSIGPLEIRVVRPGTFEELMDYAISRGASINQYNVPRCVTFPPIIELLDLVRSTQLI